MTPAAVDLSVDHKRLLRAYDRLSTICGHQRKEDRDEAQRTSPADLCFDILFLLMKENSTDC